MRKLLVAVVLVLMLVIGGLAVVVLNLDRYLNENKDWIAERVRTAVGRPVEFDSVKASFVGGIGVEVIDLAVADDPAFSGGDVLRVASVLVRIRFWPALLGRIEMGRIVLREPVLTVIRTESGLNVATPETASEARDEEREPASAALAIAFVDIHDGIVHYVDRAQAQRREVATRQIDFTATDVRMDAPVSFELRASLMGAKSQNLRAHGSVGPLNTTTPNETPLRVNVEIDPLDLDAVASTGFSPASGADVSGIVRFESSASGTLGAYDAKLVVDATRAGLGFGETAGKPTGMPLRLELAATPDSGGFRITDGTLTFDQSRLSIRGIVGAAPTSYDLQIGGSTIALEALSRLLPVLKTFAAEGEILPKLRLVSSGAAPPEITGAITVSGLALQPPKAPRISRLSATIELAGRSARIAPAPFELGGSRASIEGEIADLTHPELDFTLRSDRLELSSLGLDAGDDALFDAVVRGNVRPLDSGQRRDVQLSSASGRIRGIDYSGLDTKVAAEGSRIALSPFTVRVFGGSIKAEGSYDYARRDSPEFTLESSVESLDVGGLTAWLAPGAQHLLDAKADGRFSLAGTGKQWEAIRQTVVGGGHVQLRDGMLKRINVADAVLKSITGLPKLSGLLSPDLRQRHPLLFASGATPFQKLTGGFTISEGRLVTDDLTVKAQDYLIFGGGRIGLDQSVDVKATFEATPELTRDLIAQLDAARYLTGASGRIQIPFRLHGVLPAARVQPDLRFVEQALERALVDTLTGGILRPGQPAAPKHGAPENEPQSTEPPPEKPAQPEPPTVEDVLKRSLEELLGH